MPLFSKLDQEQLDLVVAGVHTRLYPEGQVIYEAGSDANDLYIIYSGSVLVERYVEGEPDYKTRLVAGDYFGQEALLRAESHLTSARAGDDTLVFLIDGDYLASLGREIPGLRTRLAMITRSFFLKWNAPIAWREPDETIYYIARRHIFFMYIKEIGPFLLALLAVPILAIGVGAGTSMLTPWLAAGFFAGLGLLWGFWNYIDWTNDYYIITDRRVIYLERVAFLYDSRTESPMDAILSVNQSTTQVGRIVGYGTVTVRSYTGTIRMGEIEQPGDVQTMIEQLLARSKTRQVVEERREIDRTIAVRLGGRAPEPVPPETQAPSRPVQVQTGGLQKFLVNFLHLRYEENGVITYRKHWFVLLQQVWWPTLILLVLFFLMVARIFDLYTFLSLGTAFTLELLAFIGIGLWWLYQYVDWSNDKYIVTADQIIDYDKKPLGTESRKTAPIKNILSIEYERLGFIGYLLNYGTVFIKVGETTFTFDYVFNPSEVQRELFNRFSEFKYQEKQAQDAAERRRLADWIEGYHHWREQGGSEESQTPPPGPTPFPM